MRNDKWHDEEMFEIVYGQVASEQKQHIVSKHNIDKHEANYTTHTDDMGNISYYLIYKGDLK